MGKWLGRCPVLLKEPVSISVQFFLIFCETFQKVHTGREEVKLSLLSDNMIVYKEGPKKSTKAIRTNKWA